VGTGHWALLVGRPFHSEGSFDENGGVVWCSVGARRWARRGGVQVSREGGNSVRDLVLKLLKRTTSVLIYHLQTAHTDTSDTHQCVRSTSSGTILRGSTPLPFVPRASSFTPRATSFRVRETHNHGGLDSETKGIADQRR
jgi:hypothetical protein